MIRRSEPMAYQKFIKTQAYLFHKKSGLPIDELEAEGWYAYAKALRSHDPQRPFKPYLKALVNNEFRKYAKKFKWNVAIDDFDTLYSNSVQPDREFEWNESLSRLTEEAREVAEIVINAPKELLDIANSRCGLTKATIRDYLIWCGWHTVTINKCFDEIGGLWT